MEKQATTFELTNEEAITLRMWANARKTEQITPVMSRVILLSSQGHPLSFTRDVIKGEIWHSKDELVQQIMHYIKEYNKHRTHPFKWTDTREALAG